MLTNILFHRTCVTDCPGGFYTDNKMCLPCDKSCSSCSGPIMTQCLSCRAGHLLHQYKGNQQICSDDCLAGYFLSKPLYQYFNFFDCYNAFMAFHSFDEFAAADLAYEDYLCNACCFYEYVNLDQYTFH